MSKVENYLKGRAESLFQELLNYEENGTTEKKLAIKLYDQLEAASRKKGVKYTDHKNELQSFLELEYSAQLIRAAVLSIYTQLKEVLLAADTLDISIEIPEDLQQVVQYVRNDQTAIFVFDKGERKFTSEAAEKMYSDQVANAITDSKLSSTFNTIIELTKKKDVDTNK